MDISFIIRRSLKLAWQHKMLWLLALLIGGSSFGSRGFDNGFSNSFGNRDGQKEQTSTTTAVLTNELNEMSGSLSNVLGDSVDEINDGPPIVLTPPNPPGPWPPLYSYLEGLIRDSALNIVLVSLSFVAYMVFVIFSFLLVKNWATGAILGGIEDAIEERPYTLARLGTCGRTSTRELIKLRLYLLLLRVLAGVAILIPLGILASFDAYLAGVLITSALTLPLIVFYIVLTFSEEFAARFVALKGVSFKGSVIQGFRVFKKNFLDALILSCSSCFILGIAYMIFIGVIAVLLMSVAGIATIPNDTALNMVYIVITLVGIPLLIAFIVGMYAMTAYFTTYINFMWSFFFRFALKKEGETNGPQQ